MEFSLLHILAFISLVLVASHAATEPETYWNSVLPNTAMPKVVKELLHSGLWTEEKGSSVAVGKGGVNVGVRNGKPDGGGTHVNVGKGGVNVGVRNGKPGGTHVSVGRKGGVGVNTGKPGGKGTSVGVGKGGVGVRTGHKGRPVYVRVKPGYSPFNYNYAATEDQLHDDPNVALFFLEKDLHKGRQMNLRFTTTAPDSVTFLPHKVSKSIPFSSNKFPEILNRFSLNPNSVEAEVMKKTIKECEQPGIRGEEKYCATSLESMIDFSTSKLGKNVEAVSTDVEEETDDHNHQLQEFSIEKAKKVEGDEAVVCHKQEYAYAVFYCHKTSTTAAYMVSMVGADGTKANAVAVCHKDTSAWNPKHLAFQVLKVKPGTVPVCHFLPEDHIVWVPK